LNPADSWDGKSNYSVSQLKCSKDYDRNGDTSWGEDCKPDGGLGNHTLMDYVRSFGCQLSRTPGAQQAARYVSVLPVAVNSSGVANVVVMANLTGIHIAPVAVNVGANLVRHKAGKKGKIKIATHPLPITQREREAFFGGDGITVMFAILVPAFIFPFPTAFSAAYVVRERETGVKAQHLMSGVDLLTYWFACIFADLLIFTVAICLVLIPLAAAGVDAMVSSEIVFAFFVFAFAQVPFGYLIGSLFSTAAAAQNFVLAFNMGVTFIFGTAGLILRSINLCWEPTIGFDDKCTMRLTDWLDPIIRFVPGVCLSEAIHVIGAVKGALKRQVRSPEWYTQCEKDMEYYQKVHWACAEGPLSFGAAGGPLLWLGLEGICFIFLLVFIDWCHLHPTPRQALQSTAPAVEKPPGWEDEDVLAESGKMPSPKEAAVHVQGVRKVYVRSRFEQWSEACCACCCPSRKRRRAENHAVKAVHFAIN